MSVFALLGAFDPDVHRRCSECPRYFRRMGNRKTCSERCMRLRRAKQDTAVREARRELRAAAAQGAPQLTLVELGIVEPTHLCFYCEKGFRPLHRRSTTCSDLCAKRWKDLAPRTKAAKTYRVELEMVRRGMMAPPPPPPAPKAPAPCVACENWKPCEGSETGGQCVAGLFRAGEPWRGSCRFQVRGGGTP
jgi:hypothetical protein